MIKDLRGLNPNPRKYPQDIIECVHNHIRNLPVMSSHYTRRKNQNRQYLESGMNISKVYKKYLEFMASHYKNVKTVSYRHYCKIFSSNYNIVFLRPAQDICDTCNSLDNVIKEGMNQGNDMSSIKKQRSHMLLKLMLLMQH